MDMYLSTLLLFCRILIMSYGQGIFLHITFGTSPVQIRCSLMLFIIMLHDGMFDNGDDGLSSKVRNVFPT